MTLEKTNPSWLDKGLVYKFRVAVYLALMFVFYYAVNGKLNVAFKYVLNCAVFAWACMEFLLAPDSDKAKELLRMALIFFMPFFLIWCYSLAIWIVELRSMDYMVRGSLNIIYMATNIMMIIGGYYLFEEKCVDYSFLMAVAANLFCAFLVGRQYGFPTLISQYIRQLVTFAGEGGTAIQRMEFHDMAYGFGAYTIYYAVHRRNGRIEWLYLALAVMSVCFSMKRIAVLAIAAGSAVGWMYALLNDKWRKRMFIAIGLAFVVSGFGFVWAIKSKLFLKLVDQFGLATSGRDYIYYTIDDLYNVSLSFIGHGIRFIYQHENSRGGWGSIHCVYLELFVELGFYMFFIWILYELFFRQKWLAGIAGWESLGMIIAQTCYSFITYFTDNTSFQPPINIIYRMAAMVCIFEMMAKDGKLKWKRYIPSPNDDRKMFSWLVRKKNRKALTN